MTRGFGAVLNNGSGGMYMRVLLIRSSGFLVWVAFAVSQAWAFEENPKNGSGAREKSQAEQKPDPGSLQTIRSEIELMKAEYEKRIKELEARLEQLQAQILQVSTATPAPEQAAPPPSERPVQSIPGALNPAISAIGNFVGRADSKKVFNEDGNRIDNKLNLREG